MRVVFDTNVVLDWLLEREPFAEAAMELLSMSGFRRIQGSVAATTVTTIDYLCAKTTGRTQARRQVRKTVSILEVLSIDRRVIIAALDSPMTDFEDAVIAVAAEQGGADAIATRDKKCFARFKVPAYTPDELLAMIDAQE